MLIPLLQAAQAERLKFASSDELEDPVTAGSPETCSSTEAAVSGRSAPDVDSVGSGDGLPDQNTVALVAKGQFRLWPV